MMRIFLELKNNKYNKQLEWLFGAVLIVLLNSIQVFTQLQANYPLYKIGIFLVFSLSLHIAQLHYSMGIEHVKYEIVKKKSVTCIYWSLVISNTVSYLLLFTISIQWYIPLGLLGVLAMYYLLQKELGYSVLFYHISIILLLEEDIHNKLLLLLLIAITIIITNLYWTSLLYRKHRVYMGITLFSTYVAIYIIKQRFLLFDLGQIILVYGITTTLYVSTLKYLYQIKCQPIRNTEAVSLIKNVERETHYRLLNILQGISSDEFYFARLVSTVSSKAARCINIEPSTAKLGGLYHSIGKSQQGNYVINSTNILRNEGFSDEVVEVVKNHNLNYGRPETKSSFIVMITISVLYTLARLNIISKEHRYTMVRENNKEHTKEYIQTIIEQVIELRMKRSMVKHSILTELELMKLKRFFTEDLIELFVLNGKEDI